MVTAAGRFVGKVAIVTGGLGAIGMATARRLASEGASVVVVDRTESADAPRELIELGAPGAYSWAANVADEQQVRAICDRTVAALGRLDVIVNVAGAMIFKLLRDLNSAEWLESLSVNLVGPAHFTANAFRLMPEGGAIVNVASVHAHQTSPLVAPYAAAKAGLLSLTRSAAIEGKSQGIRANAVLPGAIDTPMLWSNPNVQSGAEVVDPSFIGKPDDIAAAVAFLASDEAGFISGSNLLVEGGRLSGL